MMPPVVPPATTACQPVPTWLADAAASRPSPKEAAAFLLRLASEAVRNRSTDAVMSFAVQARRLATADAIQELLAAAGARTAGLSSLALALRFRGTEVLAPVLERLNQSEDIPARRAYLQLALALSRFAELRQPLVHILMNDLDCPQWFVVRNAIGLLSDLGAAVPPRHELATHANRQVRLALTKALARTTREPAALDSLIFLLGDPDTSVRYSAVVALGAADTPRGRMALSLHASSETDPETLHACRVIIHRRTERKIA